MNGKDSTATARTGRRKNGGWKALFAACREPHPYCRSFVACREPHTRCWSQNYVWRGKMARGHTQSLLVALSTSETWLASCKMHWHRKHATIPISLQGKQRHQNGLPRLLPALWLGSMLHGCPMIGVGFKSLGVFKRLQPSRFVFNSWESAGVMTRYWVRLTISVQGGLSFSQALSMYLRSATLQYARQYAGQWPQLKFLVSGKHIRLHFVFLICLARNRIFRAVEGCWHRDLARTS